MRKKAMSFLDFFQLLFFLLFLSWQSFFVFFSLFVLIFFYLSTLTGQILAALHQFFRVQIKLPRLNIERPCIVKPEELQGWTQRLCPNIIFEIIVGVFPISRNYFPISFGAKSGNSYKFFHVVILIIKYVLTVFQLNLRFSFTPNARPSLLPAFAAHFPIFDSFNFSFQLDFFLPPSSKNALFPCQTVSCSMNSSKDKRNTFISS